MNSKEKIINDYDRFIKFVIKKMKLGFLYDNIYDAGLIGFTKGINSYDETKNIKITTYLYKCIKHEIIIELKKENLYKERFNTISLNTYVDDEKKTELQDFISYYEDYDRNLYMQEIYKVINERISKLTKKQEMVFKHLYGLDGYIELNESEIARKYNISRQSVYQIHKRTINKLKYVLANYQQNYYEGAYDKKTQENTILNDI